MICFTIYIQPFTNDSNSRNNKIHKWLQVMQGWGGSCRGELGHVGVRCGGSCRGGVGHVGWGGDECELISNSHSTFYK